MASTNNANFSLLSQNEIDVLVKFLLEKKEQEIWESALELGLFDQVVQKGWKSLTARQSGKVGGIMAARRKIKEDKTKSKEDL